MVIAGEPKAYRWESAQDWLLERIDSLEKVGNTEALAHIARGLASFSDGDSVQDLFQEDMEAAGYFRPVKR